MKFTPTTMQSFAASSALPELAPPLEGPVPSGPRPRNPRPRILAAPALSDRSSLRATAAGFATMHEYGDLVVRYLKARHAIFIDRLRWNVPQTEGMEFDQYDTPQCRWIVVHEFGEVVAGVRLLPTTAACGLYTYMLRDAQLGLLQDIPTDVLFFTAPVDPVVWEASRFFITERVPAARRAEVQKLLFERMAVTARDLGAQHIIGIVPAIWARWSRRLGAEATPVGAKFSIDGTWSQSVLFNVDDFLSEAADADGATAGEDPADADRDAAPASGTAA